MNPLDWLIEIPLHLKQYAVVWIVLGLLYMTVDSLRKLLIGVALIWYYERGKK
jgi:hypothetical protein